MSLSSQDYARIAETLRRAESGTSGEIVCVLARCSGSPSSLPVLIAAVVSLALPWVLVALTQMSVTRILFLQLLCFIVGLLALSLPGVDVALIPRRLRRAQAHRLAAEQFYLRGVGRTRERTGILIFVSLAERYVRILADEGISARVGRSEWQGAVDALAQHMREGRIADGFIAAIDRCGTVLGQHFPSEAGRNELPDRIYVI